MKTVQPSKQRKRMYEAPLHRRQKMVSSHLSKDLRKQFGKRSLPARKGDEVKVMRGTHKGKTGKISRVDLKKLKIYIENIKRTKSTGEDSIIPFNPSNLMIINVVIEDPRRKKLIDRGKKSEKA